MTTYHVLVANEASDAVNEVVFRPGTGAWVVNRVNVGRRRTAVEGPHGIAVAPGGASWFVTLAHEYPEGRVARYDVLGDSIAGSTFAGRFPGEIAVTPNGRYLFITNGNLWGPAELSGITVIYVRTMTEIARPQTCAAPRGGRLDADGRMHYSGCRDADQLVQLDARRFRVANRFLLVAGSEALLPMDFTGNDPAYRGGWPGRCAPVWVESAPGGVVHVACAASRDLVTVDVVAWRVVRRLPLGGTPVQLAVTRDGRVLATLSDQRVVVVAERGGVVTRIATSAAMPQGVVVSTDGAYAFVSNEGVPGGRGAVDVIDLRTLARVASVEVEQQPGPIAFLGTSR